MWVDCFPDAPLEWPRHPIDELAIIDPSYELKTGREYPFIEMASVREDFGGIEKYEKRIWDRSGLCRFAEKDVLLGKITPCAENGKVALVNGLPDKFGIGSTEFFVLSAREGIIPEFLFAVVSAGPFHRRLISRMEGSTGRLRITRETLSKWLAIPLPQIDEQRRIAASLKLADDAITEAMAELNAARRMKKSLLSTLLQYGVPGKHSRFIESKRITYPASWTLTRLKKCGIWSAGGTPDREVATYYEGSIPWVKSGEVDYSVIMGTEEHLSEEGTKQTTCGILPVGTLLVAMYGAGVTKGKVAILGIPATTNQAVASFNGIEGVENQFVYYWFEFNYQRVRSWAAGSNQDNLSGYLLKNMSIALPDWKEQIDIVQTLAAADTAVRAVLEKTQILQASKRSLLHHILNGAVRITADVSLSIGEFT